MDREQLEVDVLAEVWESQRRYDPSKSRFTTFLSWVVLGAIKRHQRRMHPLGQSAELRGERVYIESLDQPEHDYTRTRRESLADESAVPTGDLLAADDDAAALWATVDSLPPEFSRVIRMRFGQGMNLKEIAEIEGISREGVRFREGRALRLLRQHLGVLLA